MIFGPHKATVTLYTQGNRTRVVERECRNFESAWKWAVRKSVTTNNYKGDIDPYIHIEPIKNGVHVA